MRRSSGLRRNSRGITAHSPSMKSAVPGLTPLDNNNDDASALTYALEVSRESRGDMTAMEKGQSGSDALTETSADDSAGQPNMVTLAGANDDSGAA